MVEDALSERIRRIGERMGSICVGCGRPKGEGRCPCGYGESHSIPMSDEAMDRLERTGKVERPGHRDLVQENAALTRANAELRRMLTEAQTQRDAATQRLAHVVGVVTGRLRVVKSEE